MKIPPIILTEKDRLKDLQEYAILDTEAELELDELTLLASAICQTPIALVSLVDESRQWFKSRVGLDVTETSRDISFCGHAIAGGGVLEVSDTLEDTRFSDNLFVTGAPHIRFYAGTPLVSPRGHALGTLCVIDNVPKKLSAMQLEALKVLGKQVVRQFDLKRKVKIQLTANEANHTLNQIIRSTGHIIIGTDKSGTITTFNPTAEALLGYSASEVIGKQSPALIHDIGEVVERSKLLSKELGKVIEPGFRVFVEKCDFGLIDQNEWTYIRKDGRRFSVLLSVSAIKSESGAIEGYLGTAVDLTSQRANENAVKVAQREIEDQRRRWMLGLRASKIGVWDYDLTTGTLHWDDEMFRLYGRNPNDFEGAYDAWCKGLHPEDRETSEAELTMAIEGTKQFDTKFRVRAPDGAIRYLKAVAEVMRDSTGKAVRMIGVNIDVTRFEENEKQIQTTMLELQRSNAELESFAYIASHDLQTPLRHISSYADLLSSKLNLGADPETAKWMKYIHDGTQTMKNLIDGLLSYSRVRGNEQGFEAVDLHKVVTKIATISISACPGLSIEIPELPVVQGNTTQLQQLFQNIIQNAVKFRRKTLAPRVEIRYLGSVSEHYFEIRDNGIGIAREQFDRVFQLFQRLHNKSEYEGTGIGLSICKKVVGLHGGRIWIESEVGMGTALCFTLKK